MIEYYLALMNVFEWVFLGLAIFFSSNVVDPISNQTILHVSPLLQNIQLYHGVLKYLLKFSLQQQTGQKTPKVAQGLKDEYSKAKISQVSNSYSAGETRIVKVNILCSSLQGFHSARLLNSYCTTGAAQLPTLDSCGCTWQLACVNVCNFIALKKSNTAQ